MTSHTRILSNREKYGVNFMFWQTILEIISGMAMFILHATKTGSFPAALSKEEEEELLKKTEQGDREARRKLIEHNLRLVAHITKKYYAGVGDQDDLISIGTIGLIKAVSTFNSDKGIRLATYASRCIENEILMHFRNLKKTAQDVSISEPIDTDKDGNALTLIDVIADDKNMLDDIDMHLRSEKLAEYIDAVLTDREKRIIFLRYGLLGGDEIPQREVAKKLGISRSYVSRIEKKAIEKLREKYEGK